MRVSIAEVFFKLQQHKNLFKSQLSDPPCKSSKDFPGSWKDFPGLLARPQKHLIAALEPLPPPPRGFQLQDFETSNLDHTYHLLLV